MNHSDKSTVEASVASVARTASQGAEEVAQTAMRAVGNGIDDVSSSLGNARQETGAALRQLVQDSEALVHRGIDRVREQSLHAKDATTAYIQHEPVKSMLMAAAVGAALMGLVALFSRGHSGR